jgi:hypothetical protein
LWTPAIEDCQGTQKSLRAQFVVTGDGGAFIAWELRSRVKTPASARRIIAGEETSPAPSFGLRGALIVAAANTAKTDLI